ncbi:TraE/TraK family type IV conjugative transfer system protein [Sulfurimonas sp.]|jgi:type IV conjugative transfer system protein TraE|uniref:TraE/TraK family type IV conjugative transfer system protein n=1 Tax=Sulfurimonas sp. TaxID=2022749 RepID=UPI0025CCB143|nr:TraE/TraK family type IV conjugative transfer system protein [Sulfurimonas sp.]MCK9473669.1 type IV conjugative transfer system protein TraE [Sulfurimonas sp.]
MIRKYFKNEYDRLVAKELANKIVSIILASALSISSFTIYKLYEEQKIIILPASVQKEFWATSKDVSESYLEQMGQYISTALLNVSPNSVETQFKFVLDLAAPHFYQNLKLDLENQKRYLVENGITSAFWAKSFKFEKDHITVQGMKHNIIGDKVVEKRGITLKIYFEVQSGRFYISSFTIK